MKRTVLLLLLASLLSAHPQPPQRTTWVLDSASLTYRLTHPVHEVEGTSHAARGKGFCQEAACEFLIAAPVKTFDSGDTNRDLHMLQVVRGAEFPIVTVRFSIPAEDIAQPQFQADLDVSFAGQTAHFAHVPFTQSIQGKAHTITGTVPATLADFKIDPPRFLTVPVRNEIPVKVETSWHAD